MSEPKKTKPKTPAKAGKPTKAEKPARPTKPTRPTARPKASMPAKPATSTAADVARSIDAEIRSLGDWRGAALAQVRAWIHEAIPDVVEERKWAKATNPAGVPCWSRDGLLCTGEVYQQAVKLTFPKGASLPDPKKLFNASLTGNARRAIDVKEGEKLDGKAFRELIRAAAAANRPGAK